MLKARTLYVSFNPRLREGGDKSVKIYHLADDVSIHASAREATSIQGVFQLLFEVSIHASAREATLFISFIIQKIKVSIHASAREATIHIVFILKTPTFQSTPPRGRRREVAGEVVRVNYVSIHASAREATQILRGDYILEKFQSTPPRGRRQISIRLPGGTISFNPRLREGGDEATISRKKPSAVSIHASAREATGGCSAHAPYTLVSIHASAREATGSS